jgi:hypothetical protein
MRGQDDQQLDVFSYVSPEQRVPRDHPLRPLRAMTDEALQQLKCRFSKLYATTGRPSIAPERLLRALLLQVLYSLRSERMLSSATEDWSAWVGYSRSRRRLTTWCAFAICYAAVRSRSVPEGAAARFNGSSKLN